MGELPEQARLADARLADDRHKLAMPSRGLLKSLLKNAHLGIAADEASEAAHRGRLEVRSPRTGPDQLIHIDRPLQPLDLNGTQGLDPNAALGEGQRVSRQENRAGYRQLLHPGG